MEEFIFIFQKKKDEMNKNDYSRKYFFSLNAKDARFSDETFPMSIDTFQMKY
jgi:hypothetical protein